MRSHSLPLGCRLDRYVTRLFGLSFLAALLLVVGLFLILDMATNLDEYMTADDTGYAPSSSLVGAYYLLQLPFLYVQMSPYVTLVAGLFTAARLARNNEIVAALNAGVSVRRMLAPVYLGALVLAAGLFALRDGASGELGRRRDRVLDHLTERRPAPVLENLILRDRRGRPVRLSRYELPASAEETGRGHGLSTRFVEDGLSVSIRADEATPLGEGRWALSGGQRLEDDGRVRRPIPIDRLEDPRFSERDVELYWKAGEHPLDLSLSELGTLLEREPTNAQFRTLAQYGLTFPLAGLVLLLVGLPFVTVSERGRSGERIARGFFLCVAYFGVDFVARTLGLQGQVGPLISGWLPIVLFGSLGVVLTASMRS
jgi:lipopolysaccharide export system permease protein